MSWIDRLWKRLGDADTEPRVHVMDDTGAGAWRTRREWRSTTVARSVLHYYRVQRITPGDDGNAAIHVLDTPQAQGYVFRVPTFGEANDLVQLQDLFRDRVVELGYHQQIGDQRTAPNGTVCKRIYLKPALSVDPERMDQRYGNVLLELHGTVTTPNFLKLLITPYSGRPYVPALPAAELVARLLDERGLAFS